MDLSKHIILTAPVAVASYVLTSSWEIPAGVITAGIFIDIDHFLEFWHDYEFSLNINKFFKACNSGVQSRHYILLHSYELVLFLFLMSYISSLSGFLRGMGIGLLFHIFLDYINILRQFNYKWYSFFLFSFFFRLVFLFRRDKIDKILRHSI